MVTDKCTLRIRSFYADEDETCSQHYINMLKRIYYNADVSRIIMVADNAELNLELGMLYEENVKSLFMLKNYRNSKIGVPIRYVNIDYPIAFSLGLNRFEM